MALVTVTDLREYMSDVSLTNSQMRTAQTVLDGVQQSLELYLGRPVQVVQVREKRRSNADGDLMLSVTPVYTIIGVRIATDAMTYPPDITPMSAQEADRVWDAMPANSPIVPGGIYVGTPNTWFIAEYTGGYNGYIDDSLKLAILEVASRTMVPNHDDTLTIKDDVAREPVGQPMVKGWTPEELQQFDRIRRRMVYR